jgi:hypothetical protein
MRQQPWIAPMLVSFLALGTSAPARAITDLTLSSPPEAKTAYILRDYYGFPQSSVVAVQSARPSEAAVILEIARSARVLPAKVVDLRQRGFSFWDILSRFGSSPSIFFVDIPRSRTDDLGPPYGKAWGYWRKYGTRWPRTAVLSDDDLIRVNDVKLHSLYFREDPYAVARAHSASSGHEVILRTFDEKKLGGKSAHGAHADNGRGHEDQGRSHGDEGKAHGDQGKGHGKGKGK